MQRNILNINNIPYLVEYTKADEINSVFRHTVQFVMLRNYTVQNDITLDTDIIFIPINKFKSLVRKNDNKYEVSDKLVFPYRNENYESFTSNVFDFVPDSSANFLYYRDNDIDESSDFKTDYYNLYEKTSDGYKIAYLDCDRIRIYRPHSRAHINSIISISNTINNIHFNYFCDKYENQEINISKEIKVNNNYYYEYIEIYVPNTQVLFSKDIYFNEDLNYYQKVNHKTQEFNLFNISNKKILLRNIILPYSISKACIRNNECFNCPINSKYMSIDDSYIDDLRNNIFELQLKENKTKNDILTIQELEEEIIENKKYIEFNQCPLINIKNNYVKSFLTNDINNIEYTNTEYNFLNIPFIMTLSHYDKLDTISNRYLSLAGISPVSLIFSFDNQFILSSKIDFDEHNRSVISVTNTWKYPKVKIYDDNISETEKLRDAYFYFNKITDIDAYFNFTGYDDDIFLENFSEELIESLNFNVAGCLIEMSLDIKFKNVFYRKSIGMDSGIDDFSFNLDGIFDSWKEYPEVIFVRTFFIDKYLSKVFNSNICVLTKEKFKYCLNNTNGYYKLTLPIGENSWYNKDGDMKTFFIDKINCSVNKYDVLNENIITNGNSSPSSIIYKTVFYKTHDTQHIRIRQNVVQNIGINLGEYLTKVENFKLLLEGYEFVESARNDVYVIFKIPGTYVSNQYGKYDIVDAEDDTYIASGEYELI